MIYIKINPDESLTPDEVSALGRQSAEKGVSAEDLAVSYLKQGIQAEIAKKAKTSKRKAAIR